MRFSRVLLPALFVLAAASACASTKTNDNELRTVQPKAKKNPYVITREELMDPAITSRDALTALRHLRPNFFTYRGPTDPIDYKAGHTQVSQDYGPLQALSALAAVDTRSLVEVRYLNANDAQNRFGINANGGPVIVVMTTMSAK